MSILYPTLHYYNPSLTESTRVRIESEVCIYGANAAGIAAALQLSRLGIDAVLLEPGTHIGGMAASGLSNTDVGNKDVIGGIAREYYRRCGQYYGEGEEWRAEPHVAEKVFHDKLREADVPIYYRQFLNYVEKQENRIVAIEMESGLRVRARVFIDCTYEGDLMARAGVSYHVGRESNEVYGETYNGSQLLKGHQFILPVDPYNEPGNPASGVLPGIEADSQHVEGQGDRRIQAYNFRLCLSGDSGNQRPFEKPPLYNEREYELLLRYLQAGFTEALSHLNGRIQGNKRDMNNKGAVSTDFIGRNYDYPEASYARREEIFQEHVTYHQGLMWFWRNDPRVPAAVRELLDPWGLAADEFTQTGGWPHQLYVREARRMVSSVVMTEHHCLGRERVEDAIGMASYTMDAHNARRIIRDGKVFNEGNVEIPVQPFGISLESIRPLQQECDNLLVPVCLSASHIAYGSIRMEPVFMILAQSAALITSGAIGNECAVQNVGYHELRPELEREEQVLHWSREAAAVGAA